MSGKVTNDRQVTQSRDTVHAHSHKVCKNHINEEQNRGTAASYTVEQSMIHSVTCVSRDLQVIQGHGSARTSP